MKIDNTNKGRINNRNGMFNMNKVWNMNKWGTILSWDWIEINNNRLEIVVVANNILV
jgi:hypothetical protein